MENRSLHYGQLITCFILQTTARAGKREQGNRIAKIIAEKNVEDKDKDDGDDEE